MTKRSMLLSAAALLIASTAAQAQDVLMRRPLPHKAAGTQSTGSGATAPSTSPAPTPPAGTDPVVSDQNGIRTSGYGWAVDCTALPPVCHKLDRHSNADLGAVDASECPATQSAGADTFAHDWGYLGMTEAGAEHGAQFCDGADPDANTSVYIAYGGCSSSGTSTYTCDREIYAKGFGPDDYPYAQVAVDPSHCASQPENADWTNAELMYGGIDPADVTADFARQGQACVPDNYIWINGLSCGDRTCTSVYYDDNGQPASAITSNQTDASNCASAQTVDAYGTQMLAQLGLVPGGPDAMSKCTSPDVYGAKGSCVQTVTYDTGWPQTGSAHVDASIVPTCYAVYDSSDPSTMVLSKVDVSLCRNQNPTTAQEAILDKLSPDLQDISKLPSTCTAGAVSGANYQRDSMGSDADTPIADTGTNDLNGYSDGYITHVRTVQWGADAYGLWQEDYYIPYVCTDASSGSYYTPSNQGLYSQYPMSTNECASAHAADLQSIQQFLAGAGAPIAYNIWTGEQFNELTSGQCGSGANCGFSVVDQPDKQRYHVTVIYARDNSNGNPGCSGPLCGKL